MKYSAAMLLASLVIATSCSRDSRGSRVATAQRGLADALSAQACVLPTDQPVQPLAELDERAVTGRSLSEHSAKMRAAVPPARPSPLPPEKVAPRPPPAPAPEPPVVAPDDWGPEPVVPRTARAPERRPSPLRPVRPAPAAQEEEQQDLWPSTPVAVAGAVGAGGLVLAGLAVGMGDGPPNVPMAIVGGGVSLAGFATAGILYLLETSDAKEPKKPVVVGVGPGAVQVSGGF